MYYIYAINLLLAICTCVIMTISPFLLVEGLGISMFVFSLIESFSELSAMIIRSFSGVIFDKIKDKRKIFIASTLAALVAKILLLTPSSFYILASKLFDRISNGSFSSPRDAFVFYNAKQTGKAFAILSMSKSIGIILPSLLIAYVYKDTESIIGSLENIIYVLIILTTIAFICCFFIKDKSGVVNKNKQLVNVSEFRQVFINNKKLLITFSLFFMARFSDGMIALNMKQNGVPPLIYLSTIGIFNAIMLMSAIYYGRLIDTNNTNKAILVTILSLILFNLATLCLGYAPITMSIISLLFWGVQRIGSQIVFISATNERLTKSNMLHLRGSAVGMEALLTGATYFIGASVCGYLASYNTNYMFIYSLIIASIALIYFKIAK